MKFMLCTFCLVAVLAVVSADADSAHFIPKAFYTLDSNGHKSDVHPINPHTAHYLRRLRRQVGTSSSSSSTSSSSNGGPTYFTSHSTNSHIPDVSFESRFGGESAKPISHVYHSEGVIDSSGKVHYNVHESH